MSRDAKCGLVVGLAIVVAIGVVFFRKEPRSSAARGPDAAAAVGANNLSAVPPHSIEAAAKAKPEANVE